MKQIARRVCSYSRAGREGPLDKEKLTRREGQTDRLDPALVEEITRIVLRVVESREAQEKEAGRGFGRSIVDWVFSRGITLPFLLTAVVLFAGLLMSGVPPWRAPEALAEKYRQAYLEDEMVDRHLRSGDSFLDHNRPSAAREQFDRALKLDPANPDAQIGLAKTAMFLPIEGYFDPSVELQKLKQFLDDNEIEDPTVTEVLGEDADGERGPVGDSLRKILGSLPGMGEDPGNTHVYALMGDMVLAGGYADRDAQDNALLLYEKAVRLDEGNSYAYSGMAFVKYAQGDFEGAFADYDRAIELSRGNQEYLSNRAYVLYQNGQPEDAAKDYENVTRYDASYIPAYYDLAQIYRVGGSLENAHRVQAQLIDLLNNEEVTSLAQNQGGFIFLTDAAPGHAAENLVLLAGEPEKRSYAYYSAALTSYLLEDEQEAKRYADEAAKIKMDTLAEEEVKKLVKFEIETIRERQRANAAKAEEFERRFL